MFNINDRVAVFFGGNSTFSAHARIVDAGVVTAIVGEVISTSSGLCFAKVDGYSAWVNGGGVLIPGDGWVGERPAEVAPVTRYVIERRIEFSNSRRNRWEPLKGYDNAASANDALTDLFAAARLRGFARAKGGGRVTDYRLTEVKQSGAWR